jgi:hypothetical protein
MRNGQGESYEDLPKRMKPFNECLKNVIINQIL